MAYPNIYNVTYSYSNFQQSQGDSTFPGTQIDADLEGLEDSIDSLSTFMQNVIRADGALNNGVVTFDSLSSQLQLAASSLGSAAVLGPSVAADTTPTVFDGVSGKLLKNITFGAFKTLLALAKADVGLENLDNTSDAAKNAAIAELTNKTLTAPVVNSPTGIVKGDVGLGSVDNTSDANKPVSTAQATINATKVTGPASVTDDLPAIFDGTTGKLIKSKTYAAFKALLGLTVSDIPLRGYLSGLTLSTAGSSATFGAAAGIATNSTNAFVMSLASAYTKTTSAWAVGTATGSLDTGAIAGNTWYHFYQIRRPDTGVVDVAISLSASAPTTGGSIPAAYTQFRRIGSMKTNGSAQWTKFIQDGDTFTWDVPATDVLNVANPGTAAVTRTLSTPLGVRVEAILGVFGNGAAQTDLPGAILISDLSVTDTAPSSLAAFTISVFTSLATATNFQNGGVTRVFTNALSQVRSRLQISAAGTTLTVLTYGWVDRRGRD